MSERIRIVITGDGDDAERAIKAVRREVRGLGDDQKRSKRDNDTTAASVQNLNRSLRQGAAAYVSYRAAMQGVKFSSIVTGAGLAAQSLNAVAAAAISTAAALGPLAGLGGAAAGGLVAFAQAAGTAQAATYGVNDAIKAYITGQETAGATAVKTGNAQAGAAETARNATNRLADAQRQAKYAQEQLTQARRDARRELEDMADSSGDARLAQRRAQLSLTQARAELARVRSSPDSTADDLANASLGVEEARRSVADANREARRTEEDYQRAKKQGVQGMPQVVDAQRALAAAQRDVAEASKDMAHASDKVADAAAGAAGGVDKFEQAMANLPASARGFVRALIALEPEIRAIREASADGLFPGLTAGVQDAAKQLPVLRQIAAETAAVMGRNAQRAGGIMGSDAFGKDLALVGERNALVIDRMLRSSINLAQAFRHIVVEAGPLLSWLSLASLRFTELVEAETRAGRESGDLARFFEETRATTERLASILQSTAAGLYAVGRAAHPLGDDILEAIDGAADRWEQWTESIEGQREMRAWFDDAKPAIWEMGRLLDDVAEAWLRMGADEGTAALIEQLRAELLPVVEEIMQNTTEAFGPALIGALTSVARLLGELSESGGPLVVFVDVLGMAADALASILETFPQIKTAVALLAAGASVYKALQLAAALTGVRTLVTLLRAAKVEGAGLAAIGGLNVIGGKGGKGGKGPGVGGAGGVLGGAAAGSVGGPWGALAGAAVGAGLVFGPGIVDSLKDGPGDKAREKFEEATKGAKSYREAVGKVNDEIKKLKDQERETMEHRERRGLSGGTKLTREWREEADSLRALREAMKFGSVVDEMRGNFAEAAAATRRPLAAIRDQVEINADLIKTRLGRDTAAGRRAMVSNFNQAAAGVRDAMNRGVISTEKGLAEIRKLMVAKLEEFGFSEDQAKNIRKGNRYDGGANEGSAANIMKAGGGWIGAPGERGRDEVPIVVGRGEAVLNHHQQRVVNAALAETGRGNLGSLFSRVKTPHYLASGGFAGGGVVEAGRRMQDMGYAVGEHPRFGGVAPVHTANSYHYKGLALDVNADTFPGGEGPALDKLASWLRREYAGKILELLWRTAGHHDHLHVAIGGAGTGGSGGIGGLLGAPPEIKRVLSDATGMLGGVSQGALDTVRAAAQEKVKRAWEEAGGEGPGEVPFVGQFYDGELNRVFPRHGLGEPGVRLSPDQVVKIAQSVGLPGRPFEQIAHGESDYHPGIVGDDAAAGYGNTFGYGLWQITSGVGNDAMVNSLGGFDQMLNPYKNARAAKKLYDAAGFSPWYGTRYLTSRTDNRSREGGAANIIKRAMGGFVDFAAGGKEGSESRAGLGRSAPVVTGPAKGRAQKTTGSKRFAWKPKGLKFTGKLANALPQQDQLFNLQAVIDTLGMNASRLGDQFDLTDENATRTIAVSQLGDDQLRSLGLTDAQIAALRADPDQAVEVLNQGQFSDGRGIAEHVAELTALIDRKKVIGGHLNTKQMVADGLVAAIQAAIAERKERLQEVAERISAVRARIQANTKAIRDTQKSLTAEEKKKKPNKGTLRSLRGKLVELRDERAHLIGHRTLEGADDPTPGSMLGVALKYRDSTRSGLRAYEEKLPEAQQTAAGVPGELYEQVTQPIGQWAKQIGEWLNTAAPKITIPESATDRSGTQDEIARLKAQMFDEAQKGRRLAEAQFGVFGGFAPMAAQRMLGSFARGVANVPHDGIAMLHANETVIPDPNGPFQITARDMVGGGAPPNVTVVFDGDIAGLMRHVESRVDGKVARVSEDLGRRQRLFTVAPGGTR